MREIEVDKVKDKVKELFLRANYHIGEDVLMALKEAREKEVSETGRSVLNMLLKNYKIASDEEIAICQDTGLAVLYVEIGQEVHIIGGNFEEASSLNSSLVLFILATPCSIAFNPTATASWINISVSPIVGIIYSSLSPFSSA